LLALPNTIQSYVAVIAVGLVINLALGLYLIWWDPRNPVNRLVATIQFLMVIWGGTSLAHTILTAGQVTPITFALLKVNGLINYLGSSLVGCTWLHLALLFPRRHPLAHRRWILPLLYGPNALFYLLRLTNSWHGLFYQFHLQDGEFISLRGPLFFAFIALNYSQVLLGSLLLIRSARRLDHALYRKQATILAMAGLLVLSGHVVRLSAPHLFAFDPSLLFVTFSGLLYVYGVLRYRLMGLSVILNRAVVYGLTWVALAAIVFVVISLMRPPGRPMLAWEATLSVLLLFGLLSVAHSQISDLIERSLNRGQKAYQQAIQDFMAQLTSATGSDKMLPSVVEFLVETLYAENGAIIVCDQVTGRYELRYSRGLYHRDEPTYEADDPFFAYVRELQQGDVLELIQVTVHPRYHPVRETLESRMRAWRAEVCLVLKVQDDLVGLMTLGPRIGGRSYSRSDLQLFSQVAKQMAISVYNVLHYDAIVAAQRQLASLNEELERRVAERTQRLKQRTQELGRANRELKQAQQQIVQSEKLASIGQLAAGVAHEINNPVGVILGFSQFLQRQIPPDDICAEPLSTIERESMRCKQIVQNLLDFARMGDPCWLEVDLHQILGATCRLLEYQLSKDHVELATRFDPHLPPIMADPQQMQQVFVNIVMNAQQAMPQGGRLTIETWVEGETVAVAFTDEGVGIPQEHQHRIFDPFFTTKEPGEGTGLGLSVSYGIVQRHGGRLQVESQVGRGSTFTLYLPVTQGTHAADTEVEFPKKEA
jgi:signal transduction histidine kinase